MTSKRLELVSYPTWTKDIEKWTLNEIRLNKWRFDASEDTEDLLQDCRILFFKLERTYPTVVEAPHFFTLYKTSIKRMFIDKARKQRRRITDCAPIDDLTENQLPQYEGAGHLGIILNELPDELKLALRLLTAKRVRLKLHGSKKYRHRENLNMRLKRNGVNLEDPVGTLRTYLANI